MQNLLGVQHGFASRWGDMGRPYFVGSVFFHFLWRKWWQTMDLINLELSTCPNLSVKMMFTNLLTFFFRILLACYSFFCLCMLHVVCCCCFCCCCCRCWCCCWWGCCCCCCPVIVTIQAWCQPSSHLVTVENKTVLLGRVPIACVDATQKAPTNMGSEFQSEKHQRPFRLLANVIDTFNTYTLEICWTYVSSWCPSS